MPRNGEGQTKKGLSALDVRQHERFALVARLKGANHLKDLCQTFEVKRIHNLSNDSAAARMVATIATTEGVSMSRYKKTGNEHLAISNTLNRKFTLGCPNQFWCGDVTYIWMGNVGHIWRLYSTCMAVKWWVGRCRTHLTAH
mgnify:FL=1